jgi:uncharacterized RDD family membrane protein YckC
MKLSFWMVAKAVVETCFGLGFVLAPGFVVSQFGGDLSPAAATFVRLAGTMFLASAITLWRSRKESPSSPFIRSIVLGAVLSNGIGLLATLSAVLSGAWNALGWIGVFFNASFALAFGYFLLSEASRPERAGIAAGPLAAR